MNDFPPPQGRLAAPSRTHDRGNTIADAAALLSDIFGAFAQRARHDPTAVEGIANAVVATENAIGAVPDDPVGVWAAVGIRATDLVTATWLERVRNGP